jgi:phage shock protein PspC (stress-responsive transcriptional regulator)
MNEGSGTTQRRLSRSSSSKVIAGVAGGLAEYTGLDPVIFRIGFIALAIAGGSGILMYLLAWLVIPQEGAATAPASGLIDRIRHGRWVPIVLIGVAVVILIESIGAWGGPGLWALALIAVGIALLQDEPEPAETIPTQETRSLAAGAPAVPAARVPRTPRRRSPLSAYTLGATLLAVAIAVGLTGADVFEMDLGQYLGLALAVLGAGLVVGGWWGRARLLVLAGLFVVPFMLAASIIDVPLRGTLGSRWIDGRNHQLQDSYELLAGSLQLDLSRHRFGPEPTEVDIDFVMGDVSVWVPPGVAVTTNVTMDAGRADVFGEGREGTDIFLNETDRREGLTEGELILNVRGGVGSFDTTWAYWWERDQQRRLRQEQREEATKDGAGSNPGDRDRNNNGNRTND